MELVQVLASAFALLTPTFRFDPGSPARESRQGPTLPPWALDETVLQRGVGDGEQLAGEMRSA